MNKLSYLLSDLKNCGWFETRTYIPCLSEILLMKVDLKRTVVVIVD